MQRDGSKLNTIQNEQSGLPGCSSSDWPFNRAKPQHRPTLCLKQHIHLKARLPRTANPRLNSRGLLPSSKPIEFNAAKFRLGFIEALRLFVSRIF